MQIPYMCSKMVSVFDPLNPPEPDPDPSRPYTWTVFARGSYQNEGSDRIINYSLQTFFQSRYPAYRYPMENNLFAFCTYVKGEDSIRMVCHSDTTVINSSELEPHTYLRNASVLLTDDAERCSPGIWGVEHGGGSVVPLNAGINTLESVSSYSVPFFCYVFGTCEIFRENSSWSPPESPDVYRVWIPKVVSDGRVFAVTFVVDADYRLINNPTFQSGEAWLEWCKNH